MEQKIRSCIACKRLFNSPYDRELCPICYEQMEERFDRVRRYLRENTDAGVEEVSDACSIPKKQILRWVREERLYFTSESGVGVPCLNCGITIQSGKYCESCKEKIRKEIQGVYIKPKDTTADDFSIKKNSSSKMRYLSRDKK